MKRIAALILGLTLSLACASASAGPAEVSLVLFDDGLPAADVALEVDGEVLARTADDGGLVAWLASGRHNLRLLRGRRGAGRVRPGRGRGTSRSRCSPPCRRAAAASISRSQSSGDARGVARSDAGQEQVAEPGTLRGRIRSAEDGEPVAGAQIYFSGAPGERHLRRAGPL
ncbi:MAG: hypothetical protein U5K33_07995 [Halofilum sp. (in: g-proteobacteria)]|nr:hypothetical protein [Halofilum sp. (in: g-proteobacteria)]